MRGVVNFASVSPSVQRMISVHAALSQVLWKLLRLPVKRGGGRLVGGGEDSVQTRWSFVQGMFGPVIFVPVHLILFRFDSRHAGEDWISRVWTWNRRRRSCEEFSVDTCIHTFDVDVSNVNTRDKKKTEQILRQQACWGSFFTIN